MTRLHHAGTEALYAALDRGLLEPAWLRRTLAGLRLPKADDGWIVRGQTPGHGSVRS